jgi:hypothetical protein
MTPRLPLAAFVSLSMAALIAGCGGPTDSGKKPGFVVRVVATVTDTVATVTTSFEGEQGTVTKLTLTGPAGLFQTLTPTVTLVLDNLAYQSNYQVCAIGRSVSGQEAEGCAAIVTPLSSDPCHPKGVRLPMDTIIVEWVPNNPDPGAIIDADRGINCDGSLFTNEQGNGGVFLLSNNGRMSYKSAFVHVRPNMPGGSKPIQLRWPLNNQGKYLYDATPENGTWYVNGVKVTRVSDLIPPGSGTNWPAGRGIAFNLDASGNVTQ